MNENLDPTNEHFTPEEFDVEKQLRPLSFSDFTGQDQVLENLQIFVQAANQRDEALDHTLFHGPPGLGKTTLANILANELQVGIKITSGPVLDKPGDFMYMYSKENKDFFKNIMDRKYVSFAQ